MSVVDVWWFRNSIVIGVDQFSLVHERTREVTKKDSFKVMISATIDDSLSHHTRYCFLFAIL